MNDSQTTCACGCGEAVTRGARFRQGHWARIRPRLILADTFWAKVAQGAPDECWEWQRFCDPAGYGSVWHPGRRRMMPAHRAAYELANDVALPDTPGRIGAQGEVVLHTCDNPPCCNPAHLVLGTQLDNMADMKAKGRGPDNVGASNPRARLTPGQVEEIRERFTGAHGQIAALAREYGISHGAMSHIVHERSWT